MSSRATSATPSRSPTPIRESQPRLSFPTSTLAGTTPGNALYDLESQPETLERGQRSRTPSARQRAWLESEGTKVPGSRSRSTQPSTPSTRVPPNTEDKNPRKRKAVVVSPESSDGEHQHVGTWETRNEGPSRHSADGKHTAAHPAVAAGSQSGPTESLPAPDRSTVIYELRRTLKHDPATVAKHLGWLLERDLSTASTFALEKIIEAIAHEASLPLEFKERYPQVLSLPPELLGSSGGYYRNHMNTKSNSQLSIPRTGTNPNPPTNTPPKKRTRHDYDISTSHLDREIQQPTPLLPLCTTLSGPAASRSVVPQPTVAPRPTVPWANPQPSTSSGLMSNHSGQKPLPNPTAATESESESEPEMQLPPRRPPIAPPTTHAQPSDRLRSDTSTANNTQRSPPLSQPLRDSPIPESVQLPPLMMDALCAAGVDTNGLTAASIVEWALHFAGERQSADADARSSARDGRTAGPSRAPNSDARSNLRERVQASAHARTPQQKRQHARYLPIEQPPHAETEADTLPDGNELIAAIAAAASGAVVPNKTGLGKYPGIRQRVATTAIVDLLATASVKGVYQVQGTYRKWAKDAYRRVWKRIAKEHPYERPPEDLLSTMAARVSWLRTKVKERVEIVVENGYGFIHPTTCSADRKHNRQLYKRLCPNTFHCRNLVPEENPYEHPVFIRAIGAAYFWDNDSIGVHHWQRFKPVPLPAAAFVLTIMQACVEEWQNGQHERRPLRSRRQQPIFDAHLFGLQQYLLRAPARLGRFQNQWFRYGVQLAGAALDEDEDREFCQPTTQVHQIRPDTPEPGFSEDRFTSASKGKGVATGDHDEIVTEAEDD